MNSFIYPPTPSRTTTQHLKVYSSDSYIFFLHASLCSMYRSHAFYYEYIWIYMNIYIYNMLCIQYLNTIVLHCLKWEKHVMETMVTFFSSRTKCLCLLLLQLSRLQTLIHISLLTPVLLIFIFLRLSYVEVCQAEIKDHSFAMNSQQLDCLEIVDFCTHKLGLHSISLGG